MYTPFSACFMYTCLEISRETQSWHIRCLCRIMYIISTTRETQWLVWISKDCSSSTTGETQQLARQTPRSRVEQLCALSSFYLSSSEFGHYPHDPIWASKDHHKGHAHKTHFAWEPSRWASLETFSLPSFWRLSSLLPFLAKHSSAHKINYSQRHMSGLLLKNRVNSCKFHSLQMNQGPKFAQKCHAQIGRNVSTTKLIARNINAQTESRNSIPFKNVCAQKLHTQAHPWSPQFFFSNPPQKLWWE